VDYLTKLLDRGGWERQALTTANRVLRAGQGLALLIIDLDRFKAINNICHPAGDSALRSAGAVLRKTTCPSDVVGRYGGDEFVVLLPRVGPDLATVVAGCIRHGIEHMTATAVTVPGAPAIVLPPITASIGIATYHPHRHRGLADLVLDADTALLQAKHRGGNRISVATHQQICPVRQRVSNIG
jgi:diguanylate cyclase (GGDEF)-like protein